MRSRMMTWCRPCHIWPHLRKPSAPSKTTPISTLLTISSERGAASDWHECGAVRLLPCNKAIYPKNVLKWALHMAVAINMDRQRCLPDFVFEYVFLADECTDEL